MVSPGSTCSGGAPGGSALTAIQPRSARRLPSAARRASASAAARSRSSAASARWMSSRSFASSAAGTAASTPAF
jgi:hypothetical protein